MVLIIQLWSIPEGASLHLQDVEYYAVVWTIALLADVTLALFDRCHCSASLHQQRVEKWRMTFDTPQVLCAMLMAWHRFALRESSF